MLGISLFGIREAVLMFALGFGYIICYLARKEGKGMAGLGHLIGMTIIVLSSLLILLNIFARCNFNAYNRLVGGTIMQCPTMKSGMMPQPAMPTPPKK